MVERGSFQIAISTLTGDIPIVLGSDEEVGEIDNDYREIVDRVRELGERMKQKVNERNEGVKLRSISYGGRREDGLRILLVTFDLPEKVGADFNVAGEPRPKVSDERKKEIIKDYDWVGGVIGQECGGEVKMGERLNLEVREGDYDGSGKYGVKLWVSADVSLDDYE
jgi:hypothetical protein